MEKTIRREKPRNGGKAKWEGLTRAGRSVCGNSWANVANARGEQSDQNPGQYTEAVNEHVAGLARPTGYQFLAEFERDAKQDHGEGSEQRASCGRTILGVAPRDATTSPRRP